MLGQHRFEPEDQDRFGRLSGDINPMHMDPVAARRLIAGKPVVHGMHLLLVALDRLPAGLLPLGRLRVSCDFGNPVCVGESVDFSAETDASGAVVVRAAVSGLSCCRIELSSAAVPVAPDSPPGPPQSQSQPLRSGWDASAAPLDEPPGDWPGRRFRLALPRASFAAAFPTACALLGERRVAAMALLSYQVGMVCPGLHSVFAAVEFEPGAHSDGLEVEVLKFDPRFRLFVLSFAGCIGGQLKAFQRTPPQAQPSAAELLPLVDATAFAGIRALVIGGSRGIGELTAKLLAAGSAEVAITFASGSADARQVVDDINGQGRGRARARQLDIAADDLDGWLDEVGVPDAVFYFATPRISRKKSALPDPALLDEFMQFYVHRFAALCQALDRRAQGRIVRVFYPSTVFVAERPKGMTEYAMAKAAAEVMIEDLGRSLASVRIACSRLPRLATDQTASLLSPVRTSATGVMLPAVRALLAIDR